ncbi:DNA repair protein RecO [Chloroflexota bacterium]
MTKPRNYQTEAIIIKKTKLGEADRILTFYTPHLGKIQAVAKGVRRPRSKLSGHLELLTHSQVSLARGRNLDTVTGSKTIHSFLPLKSDLWLTSCGLYCIELVNQFTADHVENHPLFQLLLEIMHHLCQADDSELVLRYYELNLLNKVGYKPQLQQCVMCRLPLQLTINSFSPGAGGMLCSGCSRNQPLTYSVSVNGQKVLRWLQNSDGDTVGRQRVTPELSREIERVMRGYVRYLLERDVKSAAWLDTLKREQETILK